jgi:hypothetical protein
MHENASPSHKPIDIQNGSDRLFGISALQFTCLKVAVPKSSGVFKVHHSLK